MTGSGRNQTAMRRRGVRVPSGRRASAGARARRRRLPRPSPRLLAAVVVLLALAAGAWLWLRDSSLVAVRRVTIVGVSGPDAAQIRLALATAAHGMTTLDVNMGPLRKAVAPYPVVKHLQVSTGFPHAMRIQVAEQVPVAMISVGGGRTAVSADGVLLRNVSVTTTLPTITAPVSSAGPRVGGAALSDVKLLAAAPYRLLAKIGTASRDAGHGLVAQLRSGPKVYFGDGSQLDAKWAALAAVLADPTSAGADYIDVTVPSRPAAGTGADTAGSPATTAGGGAVTTPSSGG
jgi:cell division protein FtsQ